MDLTPLYIPGLPGFWVYTEPSGRPVVYHAVRVAGQLLVRGHLDRGWHDPVHRLDPRLVYAGRLPGPNLPDLPAGWEWTQPKDGRWTAFYNYSAGDVREFVARLIGTIALVPVDEINPATQWTVEWRTLVGDSRSPVAGGTFDANWGVPDDTVVNALRACDEAAAAEMNDVNEERVMALFAGPADERDEGAEEGDE